MKISMTLSPESIERAAEQLREYAKRLETATAEIDRRLSEEAAEEAAQHYGPGITVEALDHGVRASGEEVVFQEFGAGARISDPFPGGVDIGVDIRRGSYSEICNTDKRAVLRNDAGKGPGGRGSKGGAEGRMIDIENYVITRLTEAILEKYPDAEVLGDYLEEIAKFPTVTITEIRNQTLTRMQDEEPVEHYATVTYEINVYSNSRIWKKEICKDILDICDRVLFPMKFVKGLTRRLPAIDHSRTVYRMYSRYTVVVDEGEVTYDEDGNENIVYHTYRG